MWGWIRNVARQIHQYVTSRPAVMAGAVVGALFGGAVAAVYVATATTAGAAAALAAAVGGGAGGAVAGGAVGAATEAIRTACLHDAPQPQTPVLVPSPAPQEQQQPVPPVPPVPPAPQVQPPAIQTPVPAAQAPVHNQEKGSRKQRGVIHEPCDDPTEQIDGSEELAERIADCESSWFASFRDCFRGLCGKKASSRTPFATLARWQHGIMWQGAVREKAGLLEPLGPGVETDKHGHRYRCVFNDDGEVDHRLLACPGRALTFGVFDEMKSDKTDRPVPGLKHVPNDWHRFRRILEDRGYEIDGGMQCRSTLTASEAEKAIERFFADGLGKISEPSANHLVLYFCGHGTPGSDNTGAWAFHDNSELSFSTIQRLWKSSPSYSKLHLTVVSDCCYSGKMVEYAVNTGAQNITVLAACANEEVKDGAFMDAYYNWVSGKITRAQALSSLDRAPQLYSTLKLPWEAAVPLLAEHMPFAVPGSQKKSQ